MGPVTVITRHAGAVEWLRRRGVEIGEVLPHVANPEAIRGKVVVGVIPLHLAAVAGVVGSIDLPQLPAELRGKELTPEQMDDAGANLVFYKVSRVDPK